MNENTFEKIGYYALKEKLSSYATSSLGKVLIERLAPATQLNVVQKRLDETKEARVILEISGGVPLQGIFNISQIIENIEKGAVLSCEDLTHVSDFLRGCRKIKTFIEGKADYAPTLYGYSLSISALMNIEEEINFVIRNNAVYSGVNKDLKKIRRHIDLEEGKIQDKLEKFLKSSSNKQYIQEFFVSERNGHYTIPIKAAYKNQVQGSVIDTSSKGSTVFIEPSAINKHTIKLLELRSEEAVEEYKVLSYLVGLIYEEVQAIRMNIEVIGEYDMIFAKAKYAIAIDGITPKINANGVTRIAEGRHPLLEGDVIPLNFEIGKDYRSLIITGPNAGGKTVVLKAIGLLTLATQLGLQLPAKEGTHISIYENIFVDIGDNQSIENALSTFSSHTKNLAEIVDKSNKSTLLLFDEIGSGTEPNEGAALAIAILGEVYKRGCITVATTHYGEIKNFSSNHPDFENAAMKFNKETLEPCYQLMIGRSGQSNALWIAKKMGIHQDILEKTRMYIEKKEYEYDLVNPNKIRKPKKIVVKDEVIEQEFFKGDKVLLIEEERSAIVYTGKDKFNNITVFIDGNMHEINVRRVRLEIPAKELYPQDYDLDTLFTGFKERKLQRDIERGSKKALKKIAKEMKRE